MNESEVVYSQIEKYEDNKEYYLYLSSISINKAYINNYQIVTKLLTGCINLFDILMIRNIRIKEIMANASTIHGEKICRKLLKMNYITNTDHESKIYCVDGKNFLETMKNIKQFIK